MSLPPRYASRWLAACGALLASAAVALSAYASHAVSAGAQSHLQLAAAFAFGHGVALAALARGPLRRLAWLALLALLVGTVLFAGGLVVAQLWELRARVAPFGGMLLIVGWLLYAVDTARK
jgi:uncharacterized membrane protein YgdD (TMEM256/DUF423 family)